jgi:glycerol-3-phosphate O-acyltransferase 3/4
MQDRYLQALGSVWFDRTSGNDRQIVSARLKAHVQDPSNNNMLIFPEGTCVNNDYAIMFKKGECESGVVCIILCVLSVCFKNALLLSFGEKKH